MTLLDNDDAERVYDEVLGMISRCAKSGIPDGIVAKVLFAIGVKALLREGYDVDEIKVLIAEVAELQPKGRGQA
jgi:hypothetical protein